MKKPILTINEALKKKIGSFYHPTETTYRTGFCPKGFIERKAYIKKGYIRKDGQKVKSSYIKSSCIKDIGNNGKTIPELAEKLNVNINELHKFNYHAHNNIDNRHKGLIKAINKLSYATVNRMLVALRTRQKAKESKKTIQLYNIYDNDIKWLKKYVINKRSKMKNNDLFKKI